MAQQGKVTGEISANKLILLRGGGRDGDYVQCDNAGKQSIVVDRVPNANERQIPIGRDLVYEHTGERTPEGVRIYEYRTGASRRWQG